jgi:hypothetical protein
MAKQQKDNVWVAEGRMELRRPSGNLNSKNLHLLRRVLFDETTFGRPNVLTWDKHGEEAK